MFGNDNFKGSLLENPCSDPVTCATLSKSLNLSELQFLDSNSPAFLVSNSELSKIIWLKKSLEQNFFTSALLTFWIGFFFPVRGLVYTMYIFSNIAEIYPVDASSNDPVVVTKNVLINCQLSPRRQNYAHWEPLLCGKCFWEMGGAPTWTIQPVPTAVQLGQDKTTAMSSAAPARLPWFPQGKWASSEELQSHWHKGCKRDSRNGSVNASIIITIIKKKTIASLCWILTTAQVLQWITSFTLPPNPEK